MIGAIIVVALAIAALAYVVAPVAARRSDTVNEPPPDDPAEEKKAAALSGLIDLEDELDSGKLSAEDFRYLRERYERDALAALKEIQDRSGRDATDDDLEREIAAVKARLRCPSCGTPRLAGAARCTRCGASF